MNMKKLEMTRHQVKIRLRAAYGEYNYRVTHDGLVFVRMAPGLKMICVGSLAEGVKLGDDIVTEFGWLK